MAGLQKLDGCCGVLELDGVSEETPEDILRCSDDRFETNYGFDEEFGTRNVVFTDVTSNRRGTASGWKFAAFIKKNSLGRITGPSPAGMNPNSRNNVVVWVWTPNAKAVERWLDAEYKKYQKERDEDGDY